MSMFRKVLLTGACATILSGAAMAKELKVEVLDRTYDAAGAMLAYTEFELSGEPLAEALGLNLDSLNPNKQADPTPFDYAAGVESYEYSEEAMYAVNLQSRQGPHLANGLVNAARGGTPEALGKRFVELMDAVGFDPAELQLNIYPISFPIAKANPAFAGKVDGTEVGTDEVELTNAKGKTRKVAVSIPAYYRDFGSLGWSEKGRDVAFTPAALGGQMLKDVMWAQDFLGGMHLKAGDKEVKAESSTQDQDGKHALGKSSKDGVNGMILTEIAWDKLRYLRDRFAYDGKNLGVKLSPAYDPAKGPIWFPAKADLTFESRNGVNALGAAKVADGASTLRDSWMLLWPLAEAYAFTDQRAEHKGQNPAFLAVFDNAPFPAAPKSNRNLDQGDDVVADDPFSLAALLSNMVFKNLDSLHFDAKAGTLVDRWDGKAGATVTTYDAAYALVALQIFQRSQDALPVGYAAAEDAEGLKTERGKRALTLIAQQADFILANLLGKDGLLADRFELGKGASAERGLATQFAGLRGLSAAFKATGDEKYRKAARALYVAIESKMFDKDVGSFADQPGKPTIHTPWVAAAISGGLREALLTLRNGEGEKDKRLDLANLTARYESWFHTIINGTSPGKGLQMAEWLGDTGELVVKGDNSGDSDKDNVLQITKAGVAPVLAGSIKVGK